MLIQIRHFPKIRIRISSFPLSVSTTNWIRIQIWISTPSHILPLESESEFKEKKGRRESQRKKVEFESLYPGSLNRSRSVKKSDKSRKLETNKSGLKKYGRKSWCYKCRRKRKYGCSWTPSCIECYGLFVYNTLCSIYFGFIILWKLQFEINLNLLLEKRKRKNEN